MKKTIKNLINTAQKTKNLNIKDAIFNDVKDLIYQFAITHNCPSNWRNIAEELAEEYKNNPDVYEALNLWDYE